jgi:ABC-type transporter Mla MlaB component
MRIASAASAVRPGEHACARLGRPEDHEVLALAFMRHGLDAGHRVMCLGDDGFCGTLMDALAKVDGRGAAARASGQLVLRSAREAYLPDQRFDPDRMIQMIRDEHMAALRAGYPALSVTGDMVWAFGGAPGAGALIDYEQRLNVETRDTLLMLCRYDQGLLALALASEVAAEHCVDIGPELAALCRTGNLAAGRTGAATGSVLRLAGELDYTAAEPLTDVLAAHFHGRLVVDLGDLEFVDVAGMRALRGRMDQPLRIIAASVSVRRLLGLLAWDTDPLVEVLSAA